MKNLLPGPTPVWIADDLSEVSTKVVDTESTYKALWDLFDGSHAPDCPLPSKKLKRRLSFCMQAKRRSKSWPSSFQQRLQLQQQTFSGQHWPAPCKRFRWAMVIFRERWDGNVFLCKNHWHQWFFDGFASPQPSPLNAFLLNLHWVRWFFQWFCF